MKRVGHSGGEPRFYILLFFLCLVLFSWPLLSVVRNDSAETIFYCLFLTWGMVILFLFLIRRSPDNKASGGKDAGHGELKDV